MKDQSLKPGWTRLLGVAAWLFAGSASATILDDGNRMTVRLPDGSDINLIGEVDNPRNYYYLPTNLKIALTPEGRPEFALIKFVTDARSSEPRQAGANLHFLVTWGLTNAQEADLRAKLQAIGNAQLRGTVPLRASDGERPSFEVLSSVLTNNNNKVLANGTAPIMPGGLAAVSALLNPTMAQLLAAGLDGTTAVSDVSLGMNFAYDVQAPAAKGKVIADWSRVEQDKDTIKAQWRQTPAGREAGNNDCFLWLFCTSSEHNVYESSYNELRNQYAFLMERNYVRFEFEETYPDERVAKIRDAFIQYFIESMAQPAESAPASAQPTQPSTSDDVPDIKTGRRYTFSRERVKNFTQRKTQEISMEYKLSIRQPWRLVGNLKSWYATAKSDPGAVIVASLNDCLFQDPIKVGFSLDGVTSDMFGHIYNNVNVVFRKKIQGGYAQDAKMIDRQSFTKDGGFITFAYNPDPQNCEAATANDYEYKVTWNVSGRGAWPANPDWQKGDQRGMALVGPLEARSIDFEGNLAGLKASGFTRITAQVRYPQLGREQEENIQLSVSSPSAGAIKTTVIYMDADAKGYVYRLILNHPNIQEPMALPWSARETDDYIYAYIPAPLLQLSPEAVAPAEEAGHHQDTGVLSRIDELLRGGNP
jgi:hypothetical protein